MNSPTVSVRYNNLDLQIPKHDFRYSFQRASVKVHEYQDGKIAIFHGPRCLGRYRTNGELIVSKETKQRLLNTA